MSKNADELNRHAAKFLQRRTMARDTTDEYADELVRYLHNYLTSVTSLIDSQRVVMRHCRGKGSEFETGAYKEHVKTSFDGHGCQASPQIGDGKRKVLRHRRRRWGRSGG